MGGGSVALSRSLKMNSSTDWAFKECHGNPPVILRSAGFKVGSGEKCSGRWKHEEFALL